MTDQQTPATVDIKPGVLFSWSAAPMLEIDSPPDIQVLVHDGYFLHVDRPRRWWHVRQWWLVARALWRMPK